MHTLNLTINNKPYHFLISGTESLAQVIRQKADLTGTKIGCEQGTCGACTVLVNEKAVLSCISPAIRYNNSSVTTIEGIAPLHKLQEQFVKQGAVQCGFCTPGMVMTALDFLKNNSNPTSHEIREALSGNVCRCTGYKKIVHAIEEYVKQNKIPETSATTFKSNGNDNKNLLSIVGTRQPYLEAEQKVTGKADFADDIPIKNPLYCRFLRSPHPHAKIISIDISEAEKMEGVKCIITGKELPVTFGVLPVSQDETAMAVEKVRYIGEIVAAVAAESEELAENACKKIKVDYEILKSFFTIEDSLKEINENEKIHSHGKNNNNIHKTAELRFGSKQEGLEKSVTHSEFNFSYLGLNHAFTEPHAAVSWWDEKGLTLISATQVPHYLHRALAKVLQVPLYKVRVIKPNVGGGFGGKSDPFTHEIIIAHLSRKTGKPVKVRFTREEVFINNHGRHPTEIKMNAGTNADGILQYIDADIKIDGGAYGSFGVVTSYYNGVMLQAPYRVNNFGFITKRVYTNKPQCGAMRGHGAVNPRFAMEVLMDDLAEKLNMDPCELRFKNFIPSFTTTVGQYRITSNGVRESLEKVMVQSKWKERRGKLPVGHGLGVACGFFISGSALPIIWNEYPQTSVHIKLDFDGRVLVTSGASDIGQGSDTMIAMVASEILGISMEKITVVAADTLLTPVDLGSYSSRVTFMVGNAVKMAAENLKEKILQAVSIRKNIEISEIHLYQDSVTSNDGKVNLNWQETVDITTAGVGAISVTGKYISPKLGGNFKGSGAGLSPSYSFGAVIAEVKVDNVTGQYEVLHLWGAHDCGKAINPLAVEGQLEGSWHMGMGQAISEGLRYYKGLILNPNYLDYPVPTSLDTPEMSTNIIESNDPEGPFGAKECGEGALLPAIPAIANAIYNATGVRVNELPITADKVYFGMRNKNNKKQ